MMNDRASRIMSEYINLNATRITVMSTRNMIKHVILKYDDHLDLIMSIEIMYMSFISSVKFQRATVMSIKLHAISKIDFIFAVFLSYKLRRVEITR